MTAPIRWDDCDDEPTGPRIWTVKVRDDLRPAYGWTEWTAYVDRATAEAEKQRALAEGYRARIVRAAP